ncbi:hypothetical protein FB567DRAFT_589180 [Paraphoma chrysanthemicola]|uniref:Uncharacterized protein n=1 Tax=Paraphoma chrysanthemicola TaxID=798071 RepID=A0A8K0RE00_9PLEO|nr:hypothetical protein FB567DRAFT_589180 [Paraphoma chrysanthemicola]
MASITYVLPAAFTVNPPDLAFLTSEQITQQVSISFPCLVHAPASTAYPSWCICQPQSRSSDLKMYTPNLIFGVSTLLSSSLDTSSPSVYPDVFAAAKVTKIEVITETQAMAYSEGVHLENYVFSGDRDDPLRQAKSPMSEAKSMTSTISSPTSFEAPDLTSYIVSSMTESSRPANKDSGTDEDHIYKLLCGTDNVQEADNSGEPEHQNDAEHLHIPTSDTDNIALPDINNVLGQSRRHQIQSHRNAAPKGKPFWTHFFVAALPQSPLSKAKSTPEHIRDLDDSDSEAIIPTNEYGKECITCPKNQDLVCINDTHYGHCDEGCVDPRRLRAGTKCVGGRIFGVKAFGEDPSTKTIG